MNENLLTITDDGLYCQIGDFYIDPWRPVDKAVITHGHADHARWGSNWYLASEESKYILEARLGSEIHLQTIPYNETININGISISLHPAGHILGSSQIRLEYRGEVWVVSGDYKSDSDKTCRSFEPLKCHTFITESTFGLPVYKWQSQQSIFNDINTWWEKNKDEKKTSLIFAYALGKAQRILSGLDTGIGPIYTHGAVEKINQCYHKIGIQLPRTKYVGGVVNRNDFVGGMVIAPPSADNPAWTKKFPYLWRAFACGWMQIRGNRRRRVVDRGFVLSDHSDWTGLLRAIEATGAENIWVSHGYSRVFVTYLRERGLNACDVYTQFEGEMEDTEDLETQ